jgi:hypothetical protein
MVEDLAQVVGELVEQAGEALGCLIRSSVASSAASLFRPPHSSSSHISPHYP